MTCLNHEIGIRFPPKKYYRLNAIAQPGMLQLSFARMVVRIQLQNEDVYVQDEQLKHVELTAIHHGSHSTHLITIQDWITTAAYPTCRIRLQHLEGTVNLSAPRFLQ